MQRAIRPDAQGFDEVRITTVPRYKESELSGDEWRISAKVELLRNGEVKHEESFGNVASAVRYVAFVHDRAIDDGKGFFAGEEGFCDQEGCHNEPTVTYRLKKRYCVGGGNCGAERKVFGEPEVRMFCNEHKFRGDSDLEDNDGNYFEIT